jgi:hypothetical protein
VTAPSTTYDWLRSAIAGTAHASAERTIAVDQHDERELPLDAPMHGRPAI